MSVNAFYLIQGLIFNVFCKFVRSVEVNYAWKFSYRVRFLRLSFLRLLRGAESTFRTCVSAEMATIALAIYILLFPFPSMLTAATLRRALLTPFLISPLTPTLSRCVYVIMRPIPYGENTYPRGLGRAERANLYSSHTDWEEGLPGKFHEPSVWLQFRSTQPRWLLRSSFSAFLQEKTLCLKPIICSNYIICKHISGSIHEPKVSDK